LWLGESENETQDGYVGERIHVLPP
jgi:hypothetical protein